MRELQELSQNTRAELTRISQPTISGIEWEIKDLEAG